MRSINRRSLSNVAGFRRIENIRFLVLLGFHRHFDLGRELAPVRMTLPGYDSSMGGVHNRIHARWPGSDRPITDSN